MPLWPFSKKKAEDNNYDYDDSYDDDFEEDIVDEDLNTTSNTSRGGSTRHSHHATAGHSYNNGGDAPAEPTDSAPDTAPATSTSGAILGDEYDETPDPVHDAIDGDSGPFDGDSVNIDDFDFSDFSTGILNLGSMLIPLPFKSEVQVEMGADGPKMLHILTEHGRCTPVAFAAPARAGQWRETVKEITQGMRNDGLDVVVEYGPWGREVVGSAPGGGGIVRIIGVDGPRWMLRMTLAAPIDHADEMATLGREITARTFVMRGKDPSLAGSSLPVALPGPLAAQVQKEMERRQKAAQEAAQAADNDTKE